MQDLLLHRDETTGKRAAGQRQKGTSALLVQHTDAFRLQDHQISAYGTTLSSAGTDGIAA